MQEILKQYEQVTFPGVIAGVSERRAKISVLPDYAQDLTESEADLFEKCLGLSGFQSTLPVWGATDYMLSISKTLLISIHAPRVGSDPCTDYSRQDNS